MVGEAVYLFAVELLHSAYPAVKLADGEEVCSSITQDLLPINQVCNMNICHGMMISWHIFILHT